MNKVFRIIRKSNMLKSLVVKNASARDIGTSPILSKAVPAGFAIKPIAVEDKEAVIDHLKEFFYLDEPLNKAIDLLENNRRCLDLEKYTTKSIPQNLSVMMLTPEKKVAGLCLNGVIRKTDVDDGSTCSDHKFSKILTFLNKVGDDARIFDRFPDVDKVFNMEIFSVDRNIRGKGICQILVNRSQEIAKEQGFRVLIVICTSYFSAKVVEKFGFKPIYSVKYDTYRQNGKPVFNTEPPHTQAVVYAKELNDSIRSKL